jgi:signal transduction histidine kinase
MLTSMLNRLFGRFFLIALSLPLVSLLLISGFLTFVDVGLPLRDGWQACRSLGDTQAVAKTAVTSCNWSTIKLPQHYLGKDAGPAGWEAYRNLFVSPDCNSGGCNFFVRGTFDVAEVFLNGSQVGSLGEDSPDLKSWRAFPLSVYLSPHLLKRAGEQNELIILSRTFRGNSWALNLPPIGIVNGPTATILSLLSVAEVVVVPVVAACMCLLAGFGISAMRASNVLGGRQLILCASFCLSAALFLISMSRVPRLFIGAGLITGIHFVFRFLYDYLFLEASFTLVSGKYKNFGFARSIALSGLFGSVVLLVWQILFEASGLKQHPPMWLYTWLLTTSWLAPGVFLLFRGNKNVRDSILLKVLGLSAVLRVFDHAAYLGIISEIYTARFIPAIQAFMFLGVLVSRLLDESNKLRISAELGYAVSQVAHDLRAPVAALRVAQRAITDNGDSEVTQLISSATERIQSIVGTLLDKFKANQRQQSYDDRCLISFDDSLQIVHKVMKEAELISGERCRLLIEASDGTNGRARINCVPTELARALSNIIDNGVRAGGGSVTLQLKSAMRSITFEVIDNGPGISEEMLSKLGTIGASFRDGGMGLGIYSTKLFTQRMGGEFSIVSSLKTGTKATLKFPVVLLVATSSPGPSSEVSAPSNR